MNATFKINCIPSVFASPFLIIIIKPFTLILTVVSLTFKVCARTPTRNQNQTSAGKSGSSLKEILSHHPSTPVNVPALSHYLPSHPDPPFVVVFFWSLVSHRGFVSGFCTICKIIILQKISSLFLLSPQQFQTYCKRNWKVIQLDKLTILPSFPFESIRTAMQLANIRGRRISIFGTSAPCNWPYNSVKTIPLEPLSLHYASVDPADYDKRIRITIAILHHMVSTFWGGSFFTFTDALLKVVLLKALYGFMRCREITSDSLFFLRQICFLIIHFFTSFILYFSETFQNWYHWSWFDLYNF